MVRIRARAADHALVQRKATYALHSIISAGQQPARGTPRLPAWRRVEQTLLVGIQFIVLAILFIGPGPHAAHLAQTHTVAL